MLEHRITLKEIAEAAKLSRSGVSRALRNDPRVPTKTCERVQAIARRLGYRPDPEVSSALRLLRQRKAERYIETLAFFSWHEDRIERAGNLYTKRLFHGARTHAEALGYHLEEMWATEPGMTGARLQAVLGSRGIRGCLIGPITGEMRNFEFAWDRFAVVAATASFPELTLHRALASNFTNAQIALAEVAELGYRRIGLLIDDYINVRTSGSIQAAFLNFQHTHPEHGIIPVLELRGLGHDPGPESVRAGEFRRLMTWLRKYQPDVVLSTRVIFHAWLLQGGRQIPRDLGFVSLEGVNVPGALSHIDQNPDEVGAAGVDLLTAVLNHTGREIPNRHLTVVVPGRWVAGPSTVPQASSPLKADKGDATAGRRSRTLR